MSAPDFEQLEPSESHQHKDTPKEALICALCECDLADEFAEVIVIYNTKSGKSGSFDSGLTLSEAGFLCDLYKAWLLNGALGVMMGTKAEAIERAIRGEDQL